METLPPARWYSPRDVTLAYVGDRRVALVHRVGRQTQWFAVARCGADWKDFRWSGFDGLATCLLMMREREDVPLAAWELYEPPRGVKLYARTDPRWVRRRHRLVREEFMSLRHAVRPSNRLLAASAGLRRERPAT